MNTLRSALSVFAMILGLAGIIGAPQGLVWVAFSAQGVVMALVAIAHSIKVEK